MLLPEPIVITRPFNCCVYVIFQNAGAIIGKGGSTIKRLRSDVRIYAQHTLYTHQGTRQQHKAFAINHISGHLVSRDIHQGTLWYSACGGKNLALVAISRTTELVPYHLVKSLQLIWRLGTRKLNLRILDLEVSCSDLTRIGGYQDDASNNGH